MFDLDQAIVDWRREMIAAGINTPEILDELESHLCEDVEQQERLGLSAEQVFAAAVQQMGEIAALKTEFKKVKRPSERIVTKRIIILVGILVALMGLGMILPALANYGHPNPLSDRAVTALSIASVLVITGASTIFFGVKLRKAQKTLE